MTDPGFTTSACRRIFGPENRLRKMLDVEAALARATAAAGLIPPEAAAAIDAACRSGSFEAAALFAEGWEAGSPVIPLIARLRELVGADAAPYVHLGATTQDIVDTGLVLQVREGLEELEAGLATIGRALAALAERHRGTLMPGRTLMQPAAPITFGLKAAVWLDGLARDLGRIRERRRRSALQLGGAVGNLAGFGADGMRVAEEMGRDLGLEVPAIPWHATRDRIGETAATLALAARTAAKIAGDVILLAQGEVGEVSTRAGASSALPGKRNPIDAIRSAAAAQVACGQASILLQARPTEHERAAGAWHAEWAAVPALFHAACAAFEALERAIDTLEVDAERMRANVERSASGGAHAGLADVLIDRVVAAFKEIEP